MASLIETGEPPRAFRELYRKPQVAGSHVAVGICPSNDSLYLPDCEVAAAYRKVYTLKYQRLVVWLMLYWSASMLTAGAIGWNADEKTKAQAKAAMTTTHDETFIMSFPSKVTYERE